MGTLTKNILINLWIILQVSQSWQTVSALRLITHPIQCFLCNCFNVITYQPPAMAHYLSIHCKLYQYKDIMKHFQNKSLIKYEVFFELLKSILVLFVCIYINQIFLN